MAPAVAISPAEVPDVTLQPPDRQEWADALIAEDGEGEGEAPLGNPEAVGQVHQITYEVEQDLADDALFRVNGKDKSWFLQKGGVSFEREDPARFRLEVEFLAGPTSRFGDEYAELSRAEQQATINWMLMVGVARADCELTGYKDCKSSGFYFLLHLSYRRTHWRIIGSPHDSELEDSEGKLYTCNPQDGDQFELPAYEGQKLSVEFADRELWLLDGGRRVLRGHWAVEGAGGLTGGTGAETEEGKLPDAAYYPAMLTPNCPTAVRAVVV